MDHVIKPPRSLHNAREQQQLVIRWQNDIEHRIPCTQLRAACRCATCRAQQARGNIPLVAADIHLEKINNLGQGLQLVFSDGHERGIFPWQYLFELGETSR
ncbi:MAG: DUF971 domain-containing protein [Moraxellaceae bacterium]|nr:MAG: DUF971 domain-containing protein [Moraxellaceae bacterium]